MAAGEQSGDLAEILTQKRNRTWYKNGRRGFRPGESLAKRDLYRSGGGGKAEAAKLPGAGIGPKQSYKRECQDFPLSSVPSFFSAFSPVGLGRSRSLSVFGVPFRSLLHEERQNASLPPVVAFPCL